ncbi:hypothetical protein GCM10025863_24980 [Microbacterium suwonense]|uniref:DUF7882 domain-containing protein n=2 Tax=Microbacterium suwonense TaxID=683047 RepID=A0ABN6X5B5_9MICO|nr:hypothetical protein GCM10025863_24980 [Microbacterium suwonense]
MPVSTQFGVEEEFVLLETARVRTASTQAARAAPRRRLHRSGSDGLKVPSMGRLRYDGTAAPITIDDATLAHLKIVIGTKLRRKESFLMTWVRHDDSDDARITIWVHPAIPLQFGFDDAAMPAVDPDQVTAMMAALNASGELVLDEYTSARASTRTQAGTRSESP